MRAVRAVVALVAVITLASCGAMPAGRGITRTYYVAAEEVDWNYLPTGRNALMDEEIGPEFYRVRGRRDTVVAFEFQKALYREYSDSSFAVMKPRTPEWEHLGFLGPVFRGAVGDTIRIVFRNRTQYPVSMHPHGVLYDKNSEGAPYVDGTDQKHDDHVPPGEDHVYIWAINERAGPGPNDPSSIIWPYHSHAKEMEDVNGGLMGAMIVTRAGAADAEGKPRDVDREFVTLFSAPLEMNTNYTAANKARYAPAGATKAGIDSIAFYGLGYVNINGWMYSNMPLDYMTVQQGDRVRWYVFAGTSFNDFHTPHWHGTTVLIGNQRKDVADLGGPLLMLTADMLADNPGIWLFHCHFAEHMHEGMSTRFQVRAAN